MLTLLFLALLTACGGGSGGGENTPPPNNTPDPDPPPLTTAQLNSASRLAGMATFGLPFDGLEALARAGEAQWLDEQFALPPSYHTPVVDDLLARLDRNELPPVNDPIDWLVQFRRFAWWHTTMTAEDQLRQRAAYALGQFLVVSDNVDVLTIYPEALSTYQDTLLEHAFGNYRDLLRAVTLHPAMGVYLSHLKQPRRGPGE